ncbi:HNH endonuclease signature motif containing protein [Streptomyces sp. B-S-A8]|uniref:HNH endonuclease signature motif containing protein n=1 Tax=Streptomyces solicavernae TaxID=3043614 RepID=A0ABT6RR48_9ACTN|nr:HNH endonuclease signature motif containing protein [Streptomyces sp. B-S-A8]MDI3386909.1 HNH endonuclease signature motif containing protein [Streptomyces sp. B-S-A8]
MSRGVQYTRELLAEAAAQCSDINQVIAFLGTRPYDNLSRYLFRRFDHFGIDVSHMPRRAGLAAKPPADELRLAVKEATSVAGTLRSLGLAPYGTRQRDLFREWIAEDNLDTSHFLGQAHQRGKPGSARSADKILVRHDGRSRTKTRLLRRALREIGVPEKCAECGTGPEWLGDPMTLEVDHINGDWSDDRQENLRLLCPNCHAVTSTWCRGGRHQASAPQARSDQ